MTTRRIALLLHELPDGSSHVDLLIAPAESDSTQDARTVSTWRCATRPDLLTEGTTLTIERIADHRPMYLALRNSTELTQGRGRVTLLRGGVVRWSTLLAIRWASGERALWRLAPSAGAAWTLTVLPNPQASGDDSESLVEPAP